MPNQPKSNARAAESSPTAQLPEIREADAPPHIAALYAEIRSAMGLPVVNLIYRHLATMPGALEWVWAVVRQLYTWGAGPAAVERVSASLEFPPIRPIAQADLTAAGVSREELEQAVVLVDVYNRGNLLNLVGLTVALGAMARAPMAPSAEAPRVGRGAALKRLGAVPSIPRITMLDPATSGIAQSLAGLHPRAGEAIVPSLYLHLATCPRFLALMPERLEPLFRSDGLPNARERLRRSVSAESNELIPTLIVDAPPPPEIKTRIATALDTFVNGLIPEMALVGLAIRAALQDDVSGELRARMPRAARRRAGWTRTS